MLHAPRTQDKKGDAVNDNDDYELANWMHLIASCILGLFALVGVAGLAGYVWGML